MTQQKDVERKQLDYRMRQVVVIVSKYRKGQVTPLQVCHEVNLLVAEYNALLIKNELAKGNTFVHSYAYKMLAERDVIEYFFATEIHRDATINNHGVCGEMFAEIGEERELFK